MEKITRSQAIADYKQVNNGKEPSLQELMDFTKDKCLQPTGIKCEDCFLMVKHQVCP